MSTHIQAALDRYQAATEKTHQANRAWEDSKAAETAARLAMNQAAKEEQEAAQELLDLVASPGVVLVDSSGVRA